MQTLSGKEQANNVCCLLHQNAAYTKLWRRGLRAAKSTQSPNSTLLHWPRPRKHFNKQHPKGTRFPTHQREDPCLSVDPLASKFKRLWRATSPDPSPRTQTHQGHRVTGSGPPYSRFFEAKPIIKNQKIVELDFSRCPSHAKTLRIRKVKCPQTISDQALSYAGGSDEIRPGFWHLWLKMRSNRARFELDRNSENFCLFFLFCCCGEGRGGRG